MGRTPRYRKPFRRRAEGKTNYYKRLKLLKSRKLRLVIRASNNHIGIQVVQSVLKGDKILISASSQELPRTFDWKANTGNIPAAYLTGYLAGLRSKKAKITDLIPDLGMIYHRNRILAALKGIIDAGIQIPVSEEFFPESLTEKINGSHIANYGKYLMAENPEKYKKVFSGYIKKKLNPSNIPQDFTNVLKKIENST
ncbi:MAG: 50S ribosomal protein L18 [Promethearchaeota archaeon]